MRVAGIVTAPLALALALALLGAGIPGSSPALARLERMGPGPAAPPAPPAPEVACPVQPAAGRVVITQAYGPWHSGLPRETFGAIDLAVDGDGDGMADPGGSWGAPLAAIEAGVVRVTHQPDLAGWHIWLETPAGRRWGYAHLDAVLAPSGETVAAGDIIGTMGASGRASGPHLDLQRWEGAENADPTPLIAAACWPAEGP